MAERYDAIVVGGGHNGLVAAAYLARAGLSTVVLERRDQVGGAVGNAEPVPGVRAPAFAHTVGRLRASVVRDLGLERHGLAFLRPDARVFAPHPDGRAVTLWSDRARTMEELKAWSPADAEAYPAFDGKVRAVASFLAHLAAATPTDLAGPTFADALTGLRLVRRLRGIGGRPEIREALRLLPMAVADQVGEAFESEPVRAALAWRGVALTAMGPWSAGTAAVLLMDSAGNDGGASGQTVFARGGPGALAASLAAAARDGGAEVRTGAEVARVLFEDGRATGVSLASGEEIRARAIVSGLDPKRTLLGLCDPGELGPTMVWRAGNIRTPGVVSKVNLVLAGLPRFPAAGEETERLAGRILVGATSIGDVDRACDASKYGRWSDPPVLEATIPTLTDPSLAPEGTHVLSAIVQWTPYELRDGAWDAQREALGEAVLSALETVAPGISALVTARQVSTPLDLERDLGLTGGHPLHAEPGLDQFFAWRPMLGAARYRLPLPGLYLCGSGAHPGGGVTGGPGQNAAREIIRELRRRT